MSFCFVFSMPNKCQTVAIKELYDLKFMYIATQNKRSCLYVERVYFLYNYF